MYQPMAEASSLSPAQSDERTALRIVPSMDSIASEHLRDTSERFHALKLSLQLEGRLLARDGHVKYYVCPTAADIDTIEHALRRLFPDSTKVETTTLPTGTVEEPTAALELHGRGEHLSDWQARCSDERLPRPAGPRKEHALFFPTFFARPSAAHRAARGRCEKWVYNRSMMVATPWPKPMHIVLRP